MAALLTCCSLAVMGSVWAGCDTSGDSVENGCRVDEDCYRQGEPRRWCEQSTGICLGFTSPPGETEDATTQDGGS